MYWIKLDDDSVFSGNTIDDALSLAQSKPY